MRCCFHTCLNLSLTWTGVQKLVHEKCKHQNVADKTLIKINFMITYTTHFAWKWYTHIKNMHKDETKNNKNIPNMWEKLEVTFSFVFLVYLALRTKNDQHKHCKLFFVSAVVVCIRKFYPQFETFETCTWLLWVWMNLRIDPACSQ